MPDQQQEQLDPTQLAEVVGQLSDEQLAQQIDDLGLDQVLNGVFDGMEEHFLPEKAAGVNSTLQYDIETSQGTKQWTVAIADGTCKTSEGPTDDPRLTLQLGIVDFIRLVLGQAQGQQLFMTGKLKLKGDMMFAMQMQTFFARPG
ncbi:MAG: SCP2 sterol-binding domain-containing protein [Actinomycetota bacterium]|nr:SCP2 sterol-binding domain-containing protein [Actinomycetota bacterium]